MVFIVGGLVLFVFFVVGSVLLLFGEEIASFAHDLNSLQEYGVLSMIVFMIGITILTCIQILRTEGRRRGIKVKIYSILFIIFCVAVLGILLYDFVVFANPPIEIKYTDLFISVNFVVLAYMVLFIAYYLSMGYKMLLRSSVKPAEILTLTIAAMSALIALAAILKS